MWLVLPSALCPSAQATAGSTSELTSQQAEALASSATSRGRRMQPRYWQRAWKRGTWIRRLSGVTCEPSTAGNGVERWISSLRGSLASRSARPASDSGSRMSGGSGPISPGSFAWFDRASSSLRTCQGSLLPDSEPCSVTWPLSGSMRSGRCYERQMLERPISGDGCLFLPTPMTNATSSGVRPEQESLQSAAMRFLPTPTAASYGRNAGGQNPGPERASLETMARRGLLPTPTSTDAKGSRRVGLAPGSNSGTTLTDAATHGEASLVLNPRFVEWMMGLPPGWTSCGFSATESSDIKQPKPGAACGGRLMR